MMTSKVSYEGVDNLSKSKLPYT